MFYLSATLALANGSILTGAAIKDGGLATIVSAGREIRYVGDDIHLANAGLADLVTAQDLVTRLYHDSVAFQNFIEGLDTNGIDGEGVTVSAAGDVADVVFQFAAHLPSGNHLYVMGSSHDEAPTIRSDDISAVIALLNADGDFGQLFAGVLS